MTRAAAGLLTLAVAMAFREPTASLVSTRIAFVRTVASSADSTYKIPGITVADAAQRSVRILESLRVM